MRESKTSKNSFNKYKVSKYVSVNKMDKYWIPKIIKKYDFKIRKTHNPPENLDIKDDQLFLAFVVGLIDGDGSIGKNNTIEIKCHSSWGKCLQKWFDRICRLSGTKDIDGRMKRPKVIMVSQIYNEKVNKYARIRTGNHIFSLFLKNNIKNIPHLHRKWSKIKNIKNKYEDIAKRKDDIIKLLNEGKPIKEIMKKLKIKKHNVYGVKYLYCRNLVRKDKRQLK